MSEIIILPSFERSIRRFKAFDVALLKKALKLFNHLLVTGEAPKGLGLTKLAPDRYELRAGLQIRIIVKKDADTYYLVLAGNHDDVRKHLRNA